MLVQENQAQDRSFLYKCLQQYFDLDLYFLKKEEQAELKKFFKNSLEISKYDRIILDLRFKKEIRQVLFLRTIPNLIIWEYDAWMNYIKDSKYFGKFSRYYELVKPVRIISSGFNVTKKLVQEGYDCRFIPKAYDDNLLKDMAYTRDIELGFIDVDTLSADTILKVNYSVDIPVNTSVGNWYVLFITDGENTSGNAEEAGKEMAKQGIKIFSIGVI